MANGRFEKGHIPANKGKKMPEEIKEKVKHTFFKKGNRPHNARNDETPYLITKKDKRTNKVEKTWYICPKDGSGKILYSKFLFKKAGINIDGKILRLKESYTYDRIPTVEDYEIITRKENIILNSYLNYPQEVRDLIQAKIVLSRIINKVNKENE